MMSGFPISPTVADNYPSDMRKCEELGRDSSLDATERALSGLLDFS